MQRQYNWLALVKAGLVGLCLLALSGPSTATEGRQHPNVLIITTDQQRVDAMSAAGNFWAKTPHMDSIAAQGIYFTQSYCSYPLCSPSRSALHTGRTPHEIGVNRNTVPINPAIPLSGQVFRAAGYDTAYAGKWHMPEPYPSDGIAGFEVLNKISRQKKLAHDVDESPAHNAWNCSSIWPPIPANRRISLARRRWRQNWNATANCSRNGTRRPRKTSIPWKHPC